MVERRLCLSLTPSHIFVPFSYSTSVKQAVRPVMRCLSHVFMFIKFYCPRLGTQ